ncbi:MAG: Gfo/Idh/MocA family protein [bacterium]
MVKVGILGAGFMGGMHAEVYRNLPNAELIAVADRDLDKAGKLAVRYGATHYATPEDLLNQEKIDAVDICLPTFLHKKYAVKAARKGKHILCEKPIALTTEDADKMIDTADKAKVKFMIGQVLRFWPEYIRLKEIYESGELGKLLNITCIRLSPTPDWAWDNWLTDPQRSGGALLDLHIHDTDYLLYLLGKPLSLICRASSLSLPYGHVFTTFTFANNVIAYAEGGWDMPNNFPFTMAYTALFEKGVVEFNSRAEKTLAVYTPGEKVEYPKVQQELVSAANTEGNIAELGGYFSEIKYFIDSVENEQEPAQASGRAARDSLKIVLSERHSAETGKIIKIGDIQE